MRRDGASELRMSVESFSFIPLALRSQQEQSDVSIGNDVKNPFLLSFALSLFRYLPHLTYTNNKITRHTQRGSNRRTNGQAEEKNKRTPIQLRIPLSRAFGKSVVTLNAKVI